MNEPKLFHSDVFMPEGVARDCKEFQARLTNWRYSRHLHEHFQNQAYENRSHTYLKDAVEKCLKSLKTTQRDVFEVELSQRADGKWSVTKYCCRIPYPDDITQDVCVAIRPQSDGTSLIVTAWMNAHNDSHKTLNKNKYTARKEWEIIR